MLLFLCSLAFSSIHCASFEFLYGSIFKQAVLNRKAITQQLSFGQ